MVASHSNICFIIVSQISDSDTTFGNWLRLKRVHVNSALSKLQVQVQVCLWRTGCMG